MHRSLTAVGLDRADHRQPPAISSHRGERDELSYKDTPRWTVYTAVMLASWGCLQDRRVPMLVFASLSLLLHSASDNQWQVRFLDLSVVVFDPGGP